MERQRVRSKWPLTLLVIVLPVLAACGGGGAPPPPPQEGKIAFTSDRDGNEEVYVMNADGSGQTNLTNHPAKDSDPWWSPDGEQIAFSSVQDGLPDIYSMKADGSDVKRLTETPALDGRVRWSPDGKRVAFYSFEAQGSGFLWVANADFTDEEALLAKIHPAGPEVGCAGGFPGGWFPDGERVLFRGSNADSKSLQICSIKTDGTDLRVIFSEPNTFSFDPTLSPDGSRIAFVSNRDGNNEIYVMDANGKNLRRITNDPGEDLNPTWSPDGEWIAFGSDRTGSSDIYIVGRDGKGLVQLTDDPANDSAPAWAAQVRLTPASSSG